MLKVKIGEDFKKLDEQKEKVEKLIKNGSQSEAYQNLIILKSDLADVSDRFTSFAQKEESTDPTEVKDVARWI
jgi:uncharacterized protein YjgD (DUF1641 family)